MMRSLGDRARTPERATGCAPAATAEEEANMVQRTSHDFPVISAEGQDAGVGFAEARFGETAMREETVFEDTGGDWANGEWGEAIGSVTLEHTPTSTPGRIWVRASFAFDDGDTVEYAGLVPGAGSWQGRGRLGYRGGTGKFAEPRGQLDVESTNPKRWG
jgi:hypothetical protein